MGIFGIPDEREADRLIAQLKAAADEVVLLAVEGFGKAGIALIVSAQHMIHDELTDLKTWVETLSIEASVDVVRRPK